MNQAIQLLKNANLLQQRVNEIKQVLNKSGITPQQAVQNLLNSGRMSQQQYNSLREIANQFAGTNY